MINAARMAELARPPADQVAQMIVRLKAVIHEETTYGELSQAFTVWTAMIRAYGDMLEGLASQYEAHHLIETGDLENLKIDGDEACQAAAQLAIDEAMERHGVTIDQLEK